MNANEILLPNSYDGIGWDSSKIDELDKKHPPFYLRLKRPQKMRKLREFVKERYVERDMKKAEIVHDLSGFFDIFMNNKVTQPRKRKKKIGNLSVDGGLFPKKKPVKNEFLQYKQYLDTFAEPNCNLRAEVDMIPNHYETVKAFFLKKKMEKYEMQKNAQQKVNLEAKLKKDLSVQHIEQTDTIETRKGESHETLVHKDFVRARTASIQDSRTSKTDESQIHHTIPDPRLINVAECVKQNLIEDTPKANPIILIRKSSVARRRSTAISEAVDKFKGQKDLEKDQKDTNDIYPDTKNGVHSFTLVNDDSFKKNQIDQMNRTNEFMKNTLEASKVVLFDNFEENTKESANPKKLLEEFFGWKPSEKKKDEWILPTINPDIIKNSKLHRRKIKPPVEPADELMPGSQTIMKHQLAFCISKGLIKRRKFPMYYPVYDKKDSVVERQKVNTATLNQTANPTMQPTIKKDKDKDNDKDRNIQVKTAQSRIRSSRNDEENHNNISSMIQ